MIAGPRPAVVFMVRHPLAEWQERAWGFARFAARGFDVLVLEVGPLMDPRAGEAASPACDAVVTRARSWADVEAFVAPLASRAVFLDMMIGMASDMDPGVLRLLRIVRRNAGRIYVVGLGDVPLAIHGNVGEHARMFVVRRLIKAADPVRLSAWIARKAIKSLQRVFELYPLPDRVFAVEGSDVLAGYVSRHGLAPERVVASNSIDYDRYLDHLDAHGGVPRTQEPICVFIDQALPHHPDLAGQGYGDMDRDEYERAMCALFDRVERDTGLRVVVAAHPVRGDVSGLFGGRETVTGRTIELVARATGVIAHASTAVSYAVLFERPVALVMTEPMVRSGFVLDIEAFAHALGVAVSRIDDPEGLAAFETDPARWSREGFADYRRRYVMSPSCAGRRTWDIVADVAHKDLAG